MHAHWDGYSQVGKWEYMDDLTYVYPKEGVVGWFDSLVMPKGAKNVKEAKAFMNFLMIQKIWQYYQIMQLTQMLFQNHKSIFLTK